MAAGAAQGDDGHGPLHAHAASLEDDGEEVRVEAAGCLVGCACCRYVLGRVDSAWKMYPVGFLFGLGFDTASEVGLLALAALGGAGAADGVPAVLVMLLPALFAAGMALVDTFDGLLVLLALAKGDGDGRRRAAPGLRADGRERVRLARHRPRDGGRPPGAVLAGDVRAARRCRRRRCSTRTRRPSG